MSNPDKTGSSLRFDIQQRISNVQVFKQHRRYGFCSEPLRYTLYAKKVPGTFRYAGNAPGTDAVSYIVSFLKHRLAFGDTMFTPDSR